MGKMHMLDRSGHITVTWDPQHDEQAKALIQKKMDAGYSFFIVVPEHMGKGPEEHRITRASDVGSLRSVKIHDPDVAKLFEEGMVEIGRQEPKDAKKTRKTRDAGEAAKSETVAVAPKTGG